jgi:Protein of unknown function (DUF1236)
MTKLRLLSTAAAILALGAGGALAQGMKDQAPEKAPAAQRHAPAEKMAPSIHQKTPETTGQGAHINRSEHKGPETTGQGSTSEKGEMKNERSPAGVSPQESSPANGGANVKSKNEHVAPSGGKSATQERSTTTTGQGAAAGAAKLSTEQRTKITTIIRKHKVQPAHLNISVHVGARVPASVHFYPLPVEVVAVYPEWRGFYYLLVGDEILVISPRTHEIVAILDV